MSGHVVSIDTLEHASAVLQGLRRKASAANRYGGPLVTLNQFDDVVQRAERDLSERRKQEQRMESLISQDPPLRQSHATSRVVGNSKDLDTPLEASPEKERELRGRGGVRRSNNVDFSSDEDDDDDFGSGGMTAAQKLERVALNRPRRAPSSPPHSPRSPNSNSFYDEEETLGDSDDDDNAALFSGFTAPINSDSVFATTGKSSSSSSSFAAQRHSSSMSVASVASSASSLPAASVVAAAAAASGVRVPVRPPAVPSSQTTKDLNARGVVVSKGGIFIRAGGRKKKGSD